VAVLERGQHALAQSMRSWQACQPRPLFSTACLSRKAVRGSNPIRGYTACRHRPAYGLPLSFFPEGLLPARARRSRADWTAETCHGAERW
jgi:hypothetical protein